MELEVDALKAAMEVKNTVTRAGMEFKEGTLNGADVVVVRSGIGKVNAALCVQTVSYTHLDVYKRQVPGSAVRSSLTSSCLSVSNWSTLELTARSIARS